MSLRKAFWTSLAVVVSCVVCSVHAAENQGEEEKEKSELAVLMGEIDKNYKLLESLSAYFSFEEVKKEHKIYSEASTGLVALCTAATTEFARPDDDKYQKLNNAMLEESENIEGVFRDTDNAVVLEDVLWQLGLLRQTCADCHKHLDIKIGTVKHDNK